MQALHSDRLVKVPCSAQVTVFKNFMAIELKKYLPLAESGQAGTYPPVINLCFSPTSCATSVKLIASSWYLGFGRQC